MHPSSYKGLQTGPIRKAAVPAGCLFQITLGLPAADDKTFQFAISYDLNLLNTLKEGSVRLNDGARKRLTHSVLIQSGYVIDKRWSAEIFLSWIRQERIVNQFSNTTQTVAQGLGDAVLLLKYKLLSNSTKHINWFIGAGPKFPTGSSDKKDKNDISLNADLQPGSGSCDVITWTQFSNNSKHRTSLTYSGTATFSLKGKNNSYLGSQIYQFGNELILIGGIADQYVINKFLWGASIQAIYRHAFQDENDGEKTPGTGGRWVFIRPGLTFKPGRTSAININASVPTYSWVRDAQLTPTVRYNASLYYEMPKNKSIYKSFKQ